MKVNFFAVFVGFIGFANIVNAAYIHYYIAAQDILWDYAPYSKLDMMGNTFPHSNETIFNRTLYYGYTDITFSSVINRESPTHGDLGPVIRAKVHDTIIIHFWNNASTVVSIHPHGLLYNIKDDGMMNGTLPGDISQIIWQIPERSGPQNGNNYTLWAYHSHINERDVYKGLIGPIVIYNKNYTNFDEQEIFVKSIIDIQGNSLDNPKDLPTPLGSVEPHEWSNHSEEESEDSEETEHSGKELFALNGYIYGNIPDVQVPLNSTAIWHLLTFGDEEDIHTMHFHGNVVYTLEGKAVDVVTLFPASFQTVIMTPDSPGRWNFHCHTLHHFEMGMYMYYNVM